MIVVMVVVVVVMAVVVMLVWVVVKIKNYFCYGCSLLCHVSSFSFEVKPGFMTLHLFYRSVKHICMPNKYFYS